MSIKWSPIEYATAITLHERDWSYNNIGRAIHRSKLSVYGKIKDRMGFKKTPTTDRDWKIARYVASQIEQGVDWYDCDFLGASK